MNKIETFTHVVHTRHTVLDKDVRPGTIIINKAAGFARWQCPCGCGNVFEIDIAECKVFDPYERFSLSEKVTGYEIDEDGAISFSTAFNDTRCPNGYIYGIEHNKVIVHVQNGPDD